VLRTAGRSGAEVMLVPLQGRDEAGGSGTSASVPIFAGFVASLLGGDFVRQVRARTHATQPACLRACLLVACCLLLLNLLLLTPTCICMPRPCRCPSLCLQLLLTMRLPLVFDLDETLLVAKSQSQMAKELKALRDIRCVGGPVLKALAAGLLDQLGGSPQVPHSCTCCVASCSGDAAPQPPAKWLSNPHVPLFLCALVCVVCAGAPRCCAPPLTRSRLPSCK
jgi:hypothetical protein